MTIIFFIRAKQNVEEQYSVVGIMEEFEKTFQVLEAYLPRFFKGALNAYRELGQGRAPSDDAWFPTQSLMQNNMVRKN